MIEGQIAHTLDSQFEICLPITIDISLQHDAIAGRIFNVAKLPTNAAEIILADPGKRLVTGHLYIGINTLQVENVFLHRIVKDDISPGTKSRVPQ